MKKVFVVLSVVLVLFLVLSTAVFSTSGTFNFSYHNYDDGDIIYEPASNYLLFDDEVGYAWLVETFGSAGVSGTFCDGWGRYLADDEGNLSAWESEMTSRIGNAWRSYPIYLAIYGGWHVDANNNVRERYMFMWWNNNDITTLTGTVYQYTEPTYVTYRVRGTTSATYAVKVASHVTTDTYFLNGIRTTSNSGTSVETYFYDGANAPEYPSFYFYGVVKYNHNSTNVVSYCSKPVFSSPFADEQHKTEIDLCYYFVDGVRGYQYISGMSTYPWAGRLDSVETDVQGLWGEHYETYYFTKWVETSPTYQAAGGVAYHSQSYVLYVSTEGEEELDLCVKSNGERIILTSNKPYVLVTPFTVVHRRVSAPYVWKSSLQYYTNIISAGEYSTLSTSVPGEWTEPADYSPPQDEIDFYTDDNQLVETITAILRFGFIPGARGHEPGINTSYLESALGDLVKPIVEIVNVFHEIAEFEPAGFPEIMILGIDISPGIVQVLERPVEFWGLNSSLSNVLKSLFTVGMIGMFIRWLMGKGRNVASGGTK